MKLSEVLKIENGQVKPRYDWRDYYEREMQGTSPSITYLSFIKLCQKEGRKVSTLELSNIFFGGK